MARQIKRQHRKVIPPSHGRSSSAFAALYPVLTWLVLCQEERQAKKEAEKKANRFKIVPHEAAAAGETSRDAGKWGGWETEVYSLASVRSIRHARYAADTLFAAAPRRRKQRRS